MRHVPESQHLKFLLSPGKSSVDVQSSLLILGQSVVAPFTEFSTIVPMVRTHSKLTSLCKNILGFNVNHLIIDQVLE